MPDVERLNHPSARLQFNRDNANAKIIKLQITGLLSAGLLQQGAHFASGESSQILVDSKVD